ncbi:hypothetical protein PEL8287_00526 [Roseovarius litorisediminis]|uniref:Uncharacterized protein n=1 Tax=Roseovarius litorisediminis TaxID=1312363 RepID=A0A1Y5RD85_9RHOB|nr:hypothetical protein PEL8287_00526 [Roseovarius litorisediminis]
MCDNTRLNGEKFSLEQDLSFDMKVVALLGVRFVRKSTALHQLDAFEIRLV